MATPNPRIPLSNTSNTPPSRRIPNENSPSRPGVATSVPASTGTGLARTPSLRQTRPLRKTPNRMSTSFAGPVDHDQEDEEAKSANAQLIKDLQEQVQRAEQASERYKKQLEVMQQRLDEASQAQMASEERDLQKQTEVDRLKAEIRDLNRQRRELEIEQEEHQQLFLQERERQMNKEAEQQATINRLNEALRLQGTERLNASRSASMADFQAADAKVDGESLRPEHLASNLAHNLQQKDETINALRLELAEAHLKLTQQEHVGDGRLLELDQAIAEMKMQNAKLKEENESFQMLLSEKTLKGNFMHHDHTDEEPSTMSTLAEELESTEEEESSEGQNEIYKKLEAESKSLRDQNKALTLYIDKIIGRLLSHEGFEHIIQDKEDAPPPPTKSYTEKALPAIPDQQAAAPATVAGVATGLLQRARSVVSRPGAKARPMSYAQPAATGPTANENPETAPSIPLNRGHRRARSDQAQADMAAAAVVQQMNRGSPMRTVSGGPMSPGIRPLSPQLSQGRASYFGGPPNSTTTRTPSGSGTRGGSSANSVTSDSHSEEQRSTTDGGSMTAQMSGDRQAQGSIPGAVMKQNQLRPLRLVQEQTASEEEMQKRANRNSVWGWFRGSTIETQDE
ncbi:uncharacterized protein Z520_08123 [Fonsecaea multimorphosa CBS 102226]|uniref:M protein, serotype 2.1 n=1 Tax=Fonsecaea multimorphosa CBS 102226 TaxID=1442371 RepID=A0A0D2H3E1_9EURO|nr:uncharacterized protein Z520_08123 [Fonsecaea multimorphosa CBS 102226]KIX96345.1 hypothetical protein Z520_08123 [Fonsecaea multimorphosa CBS 102226]OAL22004.1 hypothetical protein AYO22_07601 [Fonsecaea multimorphosa]